MKVGVVRIVTAGAVVVLAGAALLTGWRFARADIAAAVYRDRLAGLAADYESLRATYNEAVSRTAVTELVVEDGRLSVQVRDAEGVVRTIATPYDPAGEIYVDYVVLDSRLWIRRVFDVLTPPASGVVVDPSIAAIDWNTEPGAYGKAVYRQLGEGRWVVTVTGDGSLGLARADEPVALSGPPRVRDYRRVDDEVKQKLDEIGPVEILARLFGR